MFNYQDKQGIRCFSGKPDCHAAYVWIQARLRKRAPTWNKKGQTLSDRQKGNLAEFIAYHVGRQYGYPESTHLALVSNAHNPLAISSATGLDLVFIYFDPVDPNKDRVFIQEIKATGNSSLSYAKRLIDDHQKLLEPDTDLNVVSRMQAIKARLEYEHKLADTFLDRLETMTHSDPKKCDRIVFLPTLVHERKSAKPVTVLKDVRSQIAALGWILGNINPISFQLTGLDIGFDRLARNDEFDV